MTTTSRLIEEWQEEGDTDEWPYPTIHKTYLIEGDLADAVRKRSGLTGDVTSVEEVISGGYSEWTQENDYPFELQVDGTTVFTHDAYYGGSLGEDIGWRSEVPEYGFVQLKKWLEEEK
jgi:hypothetical protein